MPLLGQTGHVERSLYTAAVQLESADKIGNV